MVEGVQGAEDGVEEGVFEAEGGGVVGGVFRERMEMVRREKVYPWDNRGNRLPRDLWACAFLCLAGVESRKLKCSAKCNLSCIVEQITNCVSLPL